MSFIPTDQRVTYPARFPNSQLFDPKSAPSSLHEAFEAANLDYKIVQVPDVFEYQGVYIPTGKTRLVKEWPNGEVSYAGEGSEKYAPIDNSVIADYFSGFSEGGFKIRGVGPHGQGVWFYLTGEVKDLRVGSKTDTVSMNFMFRDDKIPGSASLGFVSTEVMRCTNAVMVISRNAPLGIRIKHHVENSRILKYAAELIIQARDKEVEAFEAYQRMARYPISSEFAKTFYTNVYKYSEERSDLAAISLDTNQAKSNATIDLIANRLKIDIENNADLKRRTDRSGKRHEYTIERMETKRELAMTSFETLAQSGYGANAWVALQGLTEADQWADNGKGDIAGDMLSGERSYNLKRGLDIIWPLVN